MVTLKPDVAPLRRPMHIGCFTITAERDASLVVVNGVALENATIGGCICLAFVRQIVADVVSGNGYFV